MHWRIAFSLKFILADVYEKVVHLSSRALIMTVFKTLSAEVLEDLSGSYCEMHH